MDAVYPLGTGSLWENNEIKYSVASLRRFAPWVDEIYTVGEDAGFYHIPHEETQHPAVNIWEKIYMACHDARVSENFLCINDDHFLLAHAPENYPNYYAYNIADYPFRDSGIKGFEHPYFRLVRRTRELLGEVLFYNIHSPFIVNKAQFISVFEKYEQAIYEDVGILVKTTYINSLMHPNPVQLEDYKTRRGETLESVRRHCKGRPVFSTDAEISEGAALFLIETFGKL